MAGGRGSMKTLEEKIEIMRHFSEGGQINSRYRDPTKPRPWELDTQPVWNWDHLDYEKVERQISIPESLVDQIINKIYFDHEDLAIELEKYL